MHGTSRTSHVCHSQLHRPDVYNIIYIILYYYILSIMIQICLHTPLVAQLHVCRLLESDIVERGSSVVECRTRNQVSPGSKRPLLPFRILNIFVLSIDAPVHSAV